MARVRTDEWILNAATNRSVVVFCPNVDWVVRYRCPRVRMPNETTLDPFGAYIGGFERIQNQNSSLDISSYVKDILFLGVIDFEDDVRMIKRHSKWYAACLNKISNFADPSKILGPHVDVNLKCRDAPCLFAPI